METPVKIRPRDREHYVSNPVLFKAYCDWYIKIAEAEAAGLETPPVPNFIAESIVKIATRLAFKPNFINYSYRDDMIGDAIENCIKTARNFNPEKSTNPFAYITTISWNAFLRRLENEKRQTYIRGKLIEEMPIDELVDVQDHDEETLQHHSQFVEYMREHSYVVGAEVSSNRKKMQQKVLHEEEESLESFMEPEPDIHGDVK